MMYLLFQGRTPLHLAAAGGHLPVLVELVTRGANVNEKDYGVNVRIGSYIDLLSNYSHCYFSLIVLK